MMLLLITAHVNNNSNNNKNPNDNIDNNNTPSASLWNSLPKHCSNHKSELTYSEWLLMCDVCCVLDVFSV